MQTTLRYASLILELLKATDIHQTYKAMEKVLKSGKTKAIGVSNFSRAELERLLKETSVVPAVHQLELHPWLQQKNFADFHKSKGIHITQYSPFGNQNEFYEGGKQMGKLIEDPTLVEIGKKYGKNGAQVALGESFGFGSIISDVPMLRRAQLGVLRMDTALFRSRKRPLASGPIWRVTSSSTLRISRRSIRWTRN